MGRNSCGFAVRARRRNVVARLLVSAELTPDQRDAAAARPADVSDHKAGRETRRHRRPTIEQAQHGDAMREAQEILHVGVHRGRRFILVQLSSYFHLVGERGTISIAPSAPNSMNANDDCCGHNDQRSTDEAWKPSRPSESK